MSRSSNPVFVNNNELAARVQRAGYSRDRQSLEARRLLNGNYLTVASTRELVEHTNRAYVGRHYGQRHVVRVVRLVETTDGNYLRKNGRNVVKIHREHIDPALASLQCLDRLVEQLEVTIDTMIELDKNRLSSGNYLTIHENDCSVLVVETTDGVFDGRDKPNFVKIHNMQQKFGFTLKMPCSPRSHIERIFEEGGVERLISAGYIPTATDTGGVLSGARSIHAEIIASDARAAMASIKKTKKRKAT